MTWRTIQWGPTETTKIYYGVQCIAQNLHVDDVYVFKSSILFRMTSVTFQHIKNWMSSDSIRCIPNGSRAMTGSGSSVGGPGPTRFSADTRNKYEFPCSSLPTRIVSSLAATVPHTIHMAPPAPAARVTSRFSMMYWTIGEPPSVSGHCHDRST